MNHRSTLAPGNRARSGHRYRDDDEPFAHGDNGRRAFPSSNSRYASAAGATGYAAAGAAGYAAEGAHHDENTSAWSANSEWAEQDSWSDGGAWAANDSWSPDADEAWTPQTDNGWTADSAWTAQPGAAWTQQGENWSQQDDNSWGAEANNGWAEGGDAWTEASDDDWSAEHSWSTENNWSSENAWGAEEEPAEGSATPTVIPARDPSRRGGAHRMPAPPTALKGRAAVVAVAAGAVVAAGQAAMASPEQPSHTIDYEAAGQIHEIAAQSVSMADPNSSPDSPQVLNVSTPANLGQFNDILEKGRKYAEDLAAAEAAKLRPLFARFAAGNFTSGFGARWGVQHLGIDVAGPIGTPIYAVADGTVIEAGPAAGFGMWVRLLHDDGTVTIYGHIDTATVSQGERVLAGDQIATMGNRGFSTGPHVHFEVWLNGVDKVDPLPWLATRGIGLGPRRD
ncbi:Murein DD-endopeptidase MepM and murein hydrolase activator NlpD, containing LysM domain [Nocardia amikacinitolerans]|nr:Murein DD-endopeptidase MepM and murein hydrolase activator NlpD, containing LysM domain [Nocardia amikacinitolerans]